MMLTTGLEKEFVPIVKEYNLLSPKEAVRKCKLRLLNKFISKEPRLYKLYSAMLGCYEHDLRIEKYGITEKIK